jgi:hypothetical protein
MAIFYDGNKTAEIAVIADDSDWTNDFYNVGELETNDNGWYVVESVDYLIEQGQDMLNAVGSCSDQKAPDKTWEVKAGDATYYYAQTGQKQCLYVRPINDEEMEFIEKRNELFGNVESAKCIDRHYYYASVTVPGRSVPFRLYYDNLDDAKAATSVFKEWEVGISTIRIVNSEVPPAFFNGCTFNEMSSNRTRRDMFEMGSEVIETFKEG